MIRLFALVCLFGFIVTKLTQHHQNDYRVRHHSIELLYGNRSYGRGDIKLVPYNKTASAISFRFYLKKELTDEILFSFQVYKFSSNEYRLIPLNVTLDFCREHGKNNFGTFDVFEFSNQTFLCPLEKGYYRVERYRPDETKWPTFIAGDFKLDLNITYREDHLIRLAWYGTLIKNEDLQDSFKLRFT